MASQSLGLRTTPWPWPTAEIWLLAAVQRNALLRLRSGSGPACLRCPQISLFQRGGGCPRPRRKGLWWGSPVSLPADREGGGAATRLGASDGREAGLSESSTGSAGRGWGERSGLEPSCPTSHTSQWGGGCRAPLSRRSLQAPGQQEGGSDLNVQTSFIGGWGAGG